MGNRGGALHNGSREIVRSHKGRRWITCVLEFRNRRRTVMSEGLYTELFFLDEAVAFAAGHRPCAECRRADYDAFRDAWQRLHGQAKRPAADEMDLELHPARIDGQGGKVTYDEVLGALPDGSFVRLEDRAYVVWKEGLILWAPEGYGERMVRPPDQIVTVLTPKPTVGCFLHGYRPDVHNSLRSAVGE